MSTTTNEQCWNEIGVAGDRSCDKLAEHVHCRNCGTYAEAARHSLQRPVGQDYLDEWARLLAEPEAAGEARDRSSLIFRIGAEWLMLPTAMVDAIAPLAPVHRIPHRGSAGLAGIVNVAGTLVPAVALDALLGIDGSATVQVSGRHVFPRLLVVRWEGQRFALPVADLEGILRHAASAVQPPAATIGRGLQRFLTGILEKNGMMIGVLDAELVGHQMARLLR
jgi:chemotaxis-related protein WspD